MLAEHSLPPGMTPPERVVHRHGCSWRGAVWTPRSLGALAAGLIESGFPELGGDHLADVWTAAVGELRDPGSPPRRELARPLVHVTGLSAGGLEAGLEALLAGTADASAARVFERAETVREATSAHRLVVVVLAATPPALVAQPLLPVLALHRPALIKSATAEPLFAPALVEALCRREPRLRSSIAAVTWPGGERELESPVLGRASSVIAYGGADALRDLEQRVGSKLVAFGPKLSLAVLGADVEPPAVAAGLAADVALFDQRGCLSVQAIYTAGDPRALASELAEALAARARDWPMGEMSRRAVAQVRQLRGVAVMRGLFQPTLDLRQGTVIVEKSAALEPSPGLRTVRIYPVPDLAEVPALLARWRGRLQGAALAGGGAWALEPVLRELGVSRCTPPGELQRTDADWQNGGIRLEEIL